MRCASWRRPRILVRHGACRPEGFESRAGSLWFQGGIVDIDLWRDAVLEAVVIAHGPAGQNTAMSVLVNGEPVGEQDLPMGIPALWTVDVPRTALARKDPADIIFLCARGSGEQKSEARAYSQPGEFTLVETRLRHPSPIQLSLSELRAGTAIAFGTPGNPRQEALLARGWYWLESDGCWSIMDLGRLEFMARIHGAHRRRPG